MACWGAVCELLDYRSSTWSSVIMQDWTWWSCVLPTWFHYQLKAIYGRAATPTFVHAFGIVCLNVSFARANSAFQVWVDWKRTFFSKHEAFSWISELLWLTLQLPEDQKCRQWCCGTAHWCFPIQLSPVAGSWYMDQENAHVILAGSWAQNRAVALKQFLAMKSAVSVLLTMYRQLWNKIKIGLYVASEWEIHWCGRKPIRSMIEMKCVFTSSAAYRLLYSHRWAKDLMLV